MKTVKTTNRILQNIAVFSTGIPPKSFERGRLITQCMDCYWSKVKAFEIEGKELAAGAKELSEKINLTKDANEKAKLGERVKSIRAELDGLYDKAVEFEIEESLLEFLTIELKELFSIEEQDYRVRGRDDMVALVNAVEALDSAV